MAVEITVNGRRHRLSVPPEMPLLWVLRDVLGLTGTKYGCGVGACGACTVHLGDRAVRACQTPVGEVEQPVTTIEAAGPATPPPAAPDPAPPGAGAEGAAAGRAGTATGTVSGAVSEAIPESTPLAPAGPGDPPDPARLRTLRALQRAWLRHQVAQCGYCQPGQIMQAAALLAATPVPSDPQIDRAMAGNLCRCGTYPRIRAAIHDAARRLQEGRP